MKTPLVVGLGNPLAGDDGVGRHLARRLRDHPRLPAGTEVLEGDDLLRLQDELVDRPVVYLVDALLEDGPAGAIHRFDELDSLDERGGSAHQIAPAQALRLLRHVSPPLRDVPVVFFGVGIRDVHIGDRLSPELHARLEDMVDELLRALDGSHPHPHPPHRPEHADPPTVPHGRRRCEEPTSM